MAVLIKNWQDSKWKIVFSKPWNLLFQIHYIFKYMLSLQNSSVLNEFQASNISNTVIDTDVVLEKITAKSCNFPFVISLKNEDECVE